ncbi:endonuclease/exonuclease/phosphatase family protein [Adhaeribacter sp. BT258]|uniref:Endonuclease/exonuclease/phosphatase family protein n=1 Tax=Adhaeribacter terrigena TaxID=2793070 RepID=A0ABS1C362_9BACT|nr:endonuclease/exonuclease/phosphatase family protein [Adhaeribacter terrigena]MBK0403799.1 endonuclease/exonuclease/phosphatase family protein [Adhaeribacter terrigena]
MKYPVKFAAGCLLASALFSCQKTPSTTPAAAPKEISVAFYNLENLFDTEDDPNKDDQEFLPTSESQWTPERYQQKLTSLASVIEKLGDADGPEILGVCEIENRKVLEDLAAQPALLPRNYRVIHFEGPDVRSIDVALFYKEGVFQPIEQTPIPVILPNATEKTRDILKVKGILNGDTILILVNHWPSKRGGAEESDPKRAAAAKTAREIVDQEQIKNQKAKILLMGDFNDTPDSKAITETLNANKNAEAEPYRQLFNAFAQMAEDKKGSYYYKGEWDMIDQMMLSKSLLTGKKLHYLPNSATIFNDERITEKEGKFAGAPLRTYAGKKYLGGYSDHFPVYIKLQAR